MKTAKNLRGYFLPHLVDAAYVLAPGKRDRNICDEYSTIRGNLDLGYSFSRAIL